VTDLICRNGDEIKKKRQDRFGEKKDSKKNLFSLFFMYVFFKHIDFVSRK